MPAPIDPEKLVVDALHALSAGDAAGAKKLLEQAERHAPNDRDVLLLKATLLAADEDVDAAVEAFDRALEEHPGDPLVSSAKASVLLDVYDDVDGALPLLEDAADRLLVAADADRDLLADVLVRLSDCRLRAGDAEGALQAAEEAGELEGGSADAMLARAAALLELGEVADVQAIVEAVLEVQPTSGRAHHLKGAVLDLTGRRDDADVAYTKAAVHEPDAYAPPTRLDAAAFEEKARAAVAAVDEPYEELATSAQVRVVDLPAPGELQAKDPPRAHHSLVVVDVADESATITFYRRAFEVAGIELDEVDELGAAALADDLDRVFDHEDALSDDGDDVEDDLDDDDQLR